MFNELKNKLDFFHSVANVHADLNILDQTRLGNELFWRLLEACAEGSSTLHLKHINADGFAGTSALRRVIRSLETAGWVVVETHPCDARARVVRATPKFAAHAEKCYRELNKVHDQYLAKLQPTTSSHGVNY